MCDKERLVSYVYDELEAEERRAFQQHLASCLACREEVQGLRAARGHLAEWSAPDAAPDCRIAGAPPAPVRRPWASPWWGLAAAAALVLAAVTTVSNLEITTDHGGLTIRTAGASLAAPADDSTRETLAALQQRLQDLEAALAARAAAADAAPVNVAPASHPREGSGMSDADLLRRVQQLIGASETRQQQQFAARLVQLVRQMQAEHNLDLIRVEQALNQHQGAWNDELFRQREEMKQMYRLVNQRQ